MIIFYIFPLHDVTVSVSTTNQEVFVARLGIERKNCAATFYAIPGFITVLKILVV